MTAEKTSFPDRFSWKNSVPLIPGLNFDEFCMSNVFIVCSHSFSPLGGISQAHQPHSFILCWNSTAKSDLEFQTRSQRLGSKVLRHPQWRFARRGVDDVANVSQRITCFHVLPGLSIPVSLILSRTWHYLSLSSIAVLYFYGQTPRLSLPALLGGHLRMC